MAIAPNSGVSVRIDTAGLAAQTRRLALFLRATGRMRDAMEEIGAMLVASTLRRFETETDSDGRRWQISARAARHGGQTLTDKAHLRQSITYIAGDDEVSVGSNLVYARIHQLGGRAGRRRKVTIPARPFLGVSDDDGKEIVNIVEEHFRRAIA